jgi:hypothetical protein
MKPLSTQTTPIEIKHKPLISEEKVKEPAQNIAEEELPQEEVTEEEENDEDESDESNEGRLLETALVGAGAAALFNQPTSTADQPAQPSQASTLAIQTTQEQSSPAINHLYSSLQNKATKNPILFYNALKDPANNIPIINSQIVQNELTALADNHNMVMYLPTENLQSIITQFGFSQIPQLEKQWVITMPLGTVTIDFLPEKISRLSISSQLLITKTDEEPLKQLTVQTTDAPFSEKQLPVIVFGLPVQKITTLSNKSIVAVTPSQLAELITQFFFELLEKGKKKEKKVIPMPKQKVSPTMRNIVGLPTIPEVPESPFKKPARKKANIKISSKQTVPQGRPGEINFFRQKSSRLPKALEQGSYRINKPNTESALKAIPKLRK